MRSNKTVFILGSGAIGLPLAAYLVNSGRTVVTVRTSKHNVPKSTIRVTVHNGTNRLSASVETISLSNLNKLDGILVIAAKSYANKTIALELKEKGATGPLVVMQNGVGVEKPFFEARFSPILRCVLYVTSEAGEIQRAIWKKAIINAVFNSICPLLDVDNGVFARDEETANLARQLVREGVTLTKRLNMELSEREFMEQIMQISKGSDQLISTLQDIRSGRQTEIESLNLEIARVADSMEPRLNLPRIELLGRMILAKSVRQRIKEP